MPSILRRTHLPVQVQQQEEHLVLKPWQVKRKELGEPVGALHGLKGKALAEPKGFIEAPEISNPQIAANPRLGCTS